MNMRPIPFRLFLVGSEFFKSRGGIQFVNCLLLRALEQMAAAVPCEVECFSYADDAAELPEGLIASLAVKWHAFSRRPYAMTSRLAQRLRQCPPHVVLFTHVNLLRLAKVVRLLAPRTRIAALGHGVEVWEPLPRGIRRALQNVDGVVAPSAYTREKLVSVNRVLPERISVLGHGIDCRWWTEHPSPSELRRGKCTLLSVTRLSRADAYKGIDVALKAMPMILEHCPQARYVIVGEGEDRKRLERIARDVGIAGSVEFRGELRDQELSQAYAEADLFVLPSLKEGFGIVFLEAMFNGLPVVAARAGGSMDVVVNGQTGILVTPNDGEELARAVSGLLANSTQRERMGAAGRQRVMEQFQFEHFASRWQRWLVQLAPEAFYLARQTAAFLGEPAAVLPLS